jgi:toxin ParE1/3/4
VRCYWTVAAENDLFEIGVYTWTQWGEQQYVRYNALLIETCERIIPEHAHLARPVVGRKGLHLWTCERHVVYFRAVSGGIEIVRVLHERMLPENHL